MKIKAVIFDLDGTLVDSEKYNFYAWQKFLDLHGMEIDLEYYAKNFAGESKDYIAKRCEELFSIDYKIIIEEKDVYYDEFLAAEPVTEMPYAIDTLEKLKENGIKLACATSGLYEEVMHKFDVLDLSKYFSAVVTADDVKNPKPYPEIYLLALDKLGIQSSDAIAVEDTLTGYKSADAAGLKTYIIKSYLNKYMSFPTDNILESLNEIPDIVI